MDFMRQLGNRNTIASNAEYLWLYNIHIPYCIYPPQIS